MNFIAIETSTSVCSAALFNNSDCVASHTDLEGQNHAKQLPLFIESLLSTAQNKNLHIDAVSLSQGPGSYTGLRIGTALAKGLCYGQNIPLIAIDTLKIMAYGVGKQLNNDSLLCPMIDARRMEVYTALYNSAYQQIKPTSASIIDSSFLQKELENNTIYFFGNGAGKCKKIITHENAIFIDDISPLASQMGELTIQHFNAQQFADIAYFDPFYLKEFQATVAKNKVFTC